MVFNEALSIPSLYHSLINPNELQHHHTKVQDNLFCREPMKIDIPEGDLVACLQSEGTCIFLDTWTPSHRDLETLPHVVMIYNYLWLLQNVKFHEFADSVQEETEMRIVASVASLRYNLTFEFLDCDDCREPHGFCEIEGFPEDTPGEGDVLINVGEVSHRITESIRVNENKIQEVNTRKRKQGMEEKSISNLL